MVIKRLELRMKGRIGNREDEDKGEVREEEKEKIAIKMKKLEKIMKKREKEVEEKYVS